MNNYRLTIQYDGGRYKGWQRLGDSDQTIQGKIENVLSEMLGDKIEIIGCSRTDAGVHALSQIANFKTNQRLKVTEIQNYMNQYLPQDICVIRVETVPDSFHSRFHVKSKTYLYKIWNKEYSNPFMRKYSMHIENKLDIAKMNRAGSYFIGEHDFTTFSNAKSKKKSKVREIYTINIIESDGFIEIRVCGDGFLYNMVRKIVGTLIEVGLGKIEEEMIPNIILAQERDQIGSMADANGLYLEKVDFNNNNG